MSGSLTIKTFINICTVTFKAFNYDVVMNKDKTNLWHFTSFSKQNPKRYLIMCAPELSQSQTLIKLAHGKVPEGHRLVVVTSSLTNEDLEVASQKNYTLVTIQELKEYGDKMLKLRENTKPRPVIENSFVDQVLSNDDQL